MFIQREKIDYLCEKYNLKVCRLDDTYKLFIQSSIFPINNYWYLSNGKNWRLVGIGFLNLIANPFKMNTNTLRLPIHNL